MNAEVKFLSGNADNNNKNEQEINETTQKSKAIFAAIIYVLLQFIVSGIIAIVIASFYLATHKELNYDELLKAMSATDFSKLADEYKKASIIILSYANFLSYFVIVLSIILLLKNVFIEDLNKILEKPKFYAIFIPVAAIVFYGISFLIDYLVGLAAPSNTNQSTIEYMLLGDGRFVTIIFVALLAPIAEEIIYRYVIFKFTKKINVILSYALSIILFTLPHVISTDISTVGIGIWLIQTIPYATSGFLFCLIYHKSNYNIYASITAHMLNNIMAIIVVFLSAKGGI